MQHLPRAVSIEKRHLASFRGASVELHFYRAQNSVKIRLRA